MSPGVESGATDYVRSRRGATALGLSYLLVGVGLVLSIALESTELFAAVLVATLVVVGVSLSLAFRAEGVLTRENAVVGGFVLLSLGLLYGLSGYTALPWEAVVAVVLVVGAIAPNLVLRHTRLGTE